MQQQGVYVPRKSFPQLPGGVCQDPTFIETKHGSVFLLFLSWPVECVKAGRLRRELIRGFEKWR